jgi:hypothetical protein
MAEIGIRTPTVATQELCGLSQEDVTVTEWRSSRRACAGFELKHLFGWPEPRRGSPRTNGIFVV